MANAEEKETLAGARDDVDSVQTSHRASCPQCKAADLDITQMCTYGAALELAYKAVLNATEEAEVF